MGIVQIREAFNAAAQGKAVCTHARLKYERENDTEWQRLEFDGHFVANSEAFSVRSDRIGRQGDVTKAASDTAAALLGRAGALNDGP